jgi:hypothetical protein
MQNIGNEEHTRGNRADLPLRFGRVHVESRARCQLLGNSGVMRLLALQRLTPCQNLDIARRCVGAEKSREPIDDYKVLSRHADRRVGRK